MTRSGAELVDASPGDLEFFCFRTLATRVVAVDARYGLLEKSRSLAQYLCHSGMGIGAERMVLLEASRVADFSVKSFDSSGAFRSSVSGLPSAARLISELSLLPISRREVALETDWGIVPTSVLGNGESCRFEMGPANFEPGLIPVSGQAGGKLVPLVIDGQRIEVFPLALKREPIAILFNPQLAEGELESTAKILGNHSYFPEGVSVVFVNIVDRGMLFSRFFSREGVELSLDATLCSAAFFAALKLGRVGAEVMVKAPGGQCQLDFDAERERVRCTTRCDCLFKGTTNLNVLKLTSQTEPLN